MKAPLIGISSWRRPVDTAIGPNRPTHTLGVEYVEPFENAGLVPVILSPTAAVPDLVDRLDGLVLSGGDDIDPARYTNSRPEPSHYDEHRDSFEIALAREARARDLPTLAICRGLQIITVAFGGTLIPDLARSSDHQHPINPEQILAARHRVTLATGSRLHQAYNSQNLVVNTIHHQAADQLPENFIATGWACDGTIEAIEAPDWQLWAVQWHPEKLHGTAEAAQEQLLFTAFTQAVQARSSGTAITAPKGRL